MPIHVTTSTIQSLSNKTFVDYLSTTGVVYADGGNSEQWNSTFSIVQTNSADWNYQGSDIKALTANWENTYTDFSAQSAANASVYSSFNSQSADNAAVYSAVNANSASWSSVYSSFNSLSGKFDSTYSTVNFNSGSWSEAYTGFNAQSANNASVYSSVNSASGKYESAYTTVNTYSGDWSNNQYLPLSGGVVNGNVTVTGVLSTTTFYAATANITVVDITQYELSGFKVIGDFNVAGTLSASGVVYGQGGNSNNWNSTFSTVNTYSATDWNYQGSDIKALTANWENTYTDFSANSSKYESVYATTNTNSASWSEAYTAFNAQSANNESVYSTVNIQSASWDSVYSSFNSQSAGNASVYSTVNTNSASWDSVYSTVNTYSASDWNYQGTDIKALTGNWQNTYTDFSGQSANNASVYTTVNSNSASWGSSTGGGLTIFKEVSSTASPNNVTTVHALSVDSAITNVDVVLAARGNGATLAQIPNDDISGGEKRGIYATDWQKIRSIAGEVASGDYSVVGGGYENLASGFAAVIAGGNTNRSTSLFSVAVGGASNSATGQYSFVGGGGFNVASGLRSSILGGQSNNTNSLNNAHIIGSNITASLSDYTFVNNISSQGIVAAAGGNSNNWNSAYTTTNANSASWGTGGTLQSLVYTESAASLALTSSNTVSLSALATNVSVLTGNFATTNNTTLQNVDGLSFYMEPDTIYYFECYIQYTANTTTTGSELGITGPASPTTVFAQAFICNSTTVENNNLATAYGTVATNANSGGATARNARVQGLIVNGANAGNLTVQTKVENGVTGTVTYLANSFLVWYKLKA